MKSGLYITFFLFLAVLVIYALINVTMVRHSPKRQPQKPNSYHIEMREVAVPPPKGPFHIKAYDGGVLIGEWMTKPGIPMEYENDVLSFVDDITGLPVAIKGNGVCTDYSGKPEEAAAIRARLSERSMP